MKQEQIYTTTLYRLKRAPCSVFQTRAEDIEAIKTIIDLGLDQANGFVVDFNSDYSRFRKFSITGFGKQEIKC